MKSFIVASLALASGAMARTFTVYNGAALHHAFANCY